MVEHISLDVLTREVVEQEDPTLSGVRLELVPVTPAHHEFLYELATSAEVSFHWRFRGAAPPYELFVQGIWANMFCQYVVLRKPGLDPVGHVIVYGADFRNGFAYVGVATNKAVQGTSLGIEATIILIDYLFAGFPFRKLYAESLAFDFARFASGSERLFRIEGVMKAHHYYAGRYWDQYILAFYREEWELNGHALARRLVTR